MNALQQQNLLASRLGLIALLALFIPCQVLAQPNFEITPEVDELLRNGLRHMYNHDLVMAGEEFDDLIRRFPAHPSGYVYKAELIWWEALQDRDNPALQENFKHYTDEAISRGQALVKENPKDFYALLYLAAAYGNWTRFRGTINKAYMEAAQSGRKGHAYIKQASGIRRENIDCLIGTGAYNYFTGALPLVIRSIASIFGARGDKEEGIKQLELAAQKGEYGRTEAKIVLLPVYLNEGRFDDYRKTLSELMDEYPSNPVYYMWMANFFLNQKKPSDGVQFFVELIERSEQPFRGRVDLSAAYYEKAHLQMEQKNWDVAISNLTQVIEECPPDPKLTVRAHLLRGMALDLKGQHSRAILNYQTVLNLRNLENSHGKAKRYLKTPYEGGP